MHDSIRRVRRQEDRGEARREPRREVRTTIFVAAPVSMSLLLSLGAAGTARGVVLESSAVSGGAVSAVGGSFRLGGTVGESGVVGQTTGGSFRLLEGFWRPGIPAPSSVDDVTIEPPVTANDPAAPTTDPAAPGGDPLASEAGAVPAVTALLWNTPNPFRGGTTLRFDLARPARISLSIFDVSGRLMRSLVNSDLPAGRHRQTWDGRDDAGRTLVAGVYYSRLEVAGWSSSRPVILSH